MAFGTLLATHAPALGTHSAKQRAKTHSPGSLSRLHAGFLHSLRLSSPFLPLRWHRLSSLQWRFHGGTGFLACATRGGTPRLHGDAHDARSSSCRRAVSARGQGHGSAVPLQHQVTRRGDAPAGTGFRVQVCTPYVLHWEPTVQNSVPKPIPPAVSGPRVRHCVRGGFLVAKISIFRQASPMNLRKKMAPTTAIWKAAAAHAPT